MAEESDGRSRLDLPARIGRPSAFREEFSKQAKKLCELGATDDDLAEFFGVTATTVRHWQQTQRSFLEACELGKSPADDRVERSLYHRAVGYTHEDVHISVYQGEVTLTPIKKHYPPDPQSMRLWLMCRRPDKWREVVATEHSGEVTLKRGVDLSGFTDEELAALEQLSKKAVSEPDGS